MGKFIIAILLLCSVSSFAQSDSSKYYGSKDYGWYYQRVWPKKVLMLPSDTVNNKLGIAQIGSTAFIGNGAYWTAQAGTGSLYISPSDSTTKLISGSVVWDSNFIFQNTTLVYQILGRRFTAGVSSITLSGSHPTLDRRDVIYADTLGNVGILQGVNGSGSYPSVDPASQIELLQVDINAASTSPYQFSNNIIYRSGTEWTPSSNISGADFFYPTNPFDGVSAYFPGFTNGQYFKFADGGLSDLSDKSFLKFYIRLTQVFTGRYFSVKFNEAGVKRTNYLPITGGSYGFNATLLNTWQLVAIPMTEFIYTDVNFDEVYFVMSGTGTLPFQIDNVQLQSGGSTFIAGVTSFNGMTGNVIGAFTDSAKINSDTSLYEFYNKYTGAKVFTLPTLMVNLTPRDTCIVIDSIGPRQYTIGLNPYCVGSGSGSTFNPDTLEAAIALKLNISDTAGMLSGYQAAINGKQPLISILPVANGGTGTGTPGLVAGTNITSITGTWPNQTINAAGGGGGSGITKAQLPLKVNTAGDSITRRWNVLDYLPGFVSGVTNATQGIQAAINACAAAGGGEVFFPNGTYIIADTLQTNIGGLNMNAQLYIPYRAYNDTLRTHIVLKGETPPNFTNGSPLTNFPVSNSGVVLKSTLTIGANGAAVIGTKGAVQAWGAYNYTYLSVENIMVVVKNNPTGTGPVVGGISYKNGASLFTNKVVVTIDTLANFSTTPYNDVTGIETTDFSSETFSNLQNTLATGMKSGFKIGEHAVLNQCQSMTCYYAFNYKTGTHASFAMRLGSFWNAYDIYSSAGNAVTTGIQELDIEWRQAGKWFDNIATIKDSANTLTGSIFYTIIAAGSGIDNTKFSKSGGTNVNTYTNAAKIITNGQTSDMSLDGGNLYYSATNDNLGIGTAGLASSAYALELKKANPYLLINSSTSRQASIMYAQNGTNKWQFGMDFSNNGTADFYIYDQANTKIRQYINGGNVYIGGTANAQATSSIYAPAAGNVGIMGVTPTSALHTTSFATAYTATATSLTATIAHNVIDITATGQTITLPTAASITGREYTIKLTGSGTGTVATTSSQTIDGSTTYSLSAQYKYVTVKSTGTNWIIIANN